MPAGASRIFITAAAAVLIAAIAVPARPAAQPQGVQPPASSSSSVSLSRAGEATETKHLRLTTSVRRIARDRVALLIDVTPKPKMHVYSPEQKDAIPVSVALTPSEGVRPGPVSFPKSEKYFFAPLNETQLVYSRPFQISQEIAVPARRTAELTISGTLRYQACDDAICYVPQTVPVSWTVTP